MQRMSLSVVVALLSSFLMAAADEDLPDLAKVVEKHRAILESIRTGRITYVRESTRGTDDLEGFKKYYRVELEGLVRKWKAAGADDSSVALWQRYLDDFDNSAARHLLMGTRQERINCVFDKAASVVKTVSTNLRDLRDVAALMSRYGIGGDAGLYTRNYSKRVSAEMLKRLHMSGDKTPPNLYIDRRNNQELEVDALRLTGYLKPIAEGGDDQVESMTLTRDAENPNLLILEVLMRPETEEDYGFVKNGKLATVKLPLEQPRTVKIVTLVDESNNFRTVSRKVYHNDALEREYAYEYSSTEALSLPAVAKTIRYRGDGSVRYTQTYRMESVELNVEIAAGELELDVPLETVIYDFMGPEMLAIKPESHEKVIEQLDNVLEEVPAEEPEPPALVEAPEEAPAPAVVETPPRVSRAREDGGGAIMAIGIAFVVIAAIIAVALWARRRNR